MKLGSVGSYNRAFRRWETGGRIPERNVRRGWLDLQSTKHEFPSVSDRMHISIGANEKANSQPAVG